jgi:hypothetical protein
MNSQKKNTDAASKTGTSPPKAKQAAKPAATAKRATGLTKAQLEKAAKLRAEAATWNAIREAFGVKYGSTRWFALWTKHGVEHIPAGQRVKANRAPAPAAEPDKEA